MFQCLTTEDCAGRPGGSCETTGFCSFPDETCPSGRRYGEFASSAFSDICVDPDVGTSTSYESGSSSSSPGTTVVPGTGPSGSGGSGTSTDASSSVTSTSAVTVSSTTEDSAESTSGSESTQGGGTESSSGELPPQTVVVAASVAACTDPIENDPAACELSTLTQGMSVDASNNGAMGGATTAYVAFDLSEVPAGSLLLSAELRLTTTDEVNAESTTQTGEIWRTEMFTEGSLAMGQPALLGDMPIAPDQGGAASSELVVWVLPVSDVDLAETLYLAVLATTVEGVDYWNALGMAPPQLVLEISGG